MAYDATDFVVTEVPAPVRDPKSITDPRERVAYLRDFLRELPAEKFNMADYAHDLNGRTIVETSDFHTCGTAACTCMGTLGLRYPCTCGFEVQREAKRIADRNRLIKRYAPTSNPHPQIPGGNHE